MSSVKNIVYLIHIKSYINLYRKSIRISFTLIGVVIPIISSILISIMKCYDSVTKLRK